MNDLKRNFAYTPRTQNPPQALDYKQQTRRKINGLNGANEVRKSKRNVEHKLAQNIKSDSRSLYA